MKTALQELPEELLPLAGLRDTEQARKSRCSGLAVKTELVDGLVHEATRRLRAS